mmetsp:Transcript_113391/g.219637  ORF Transcript_113391/g.219637 Transcript_113391/m.219637 type:complete len:436 (-) Transcript_113391:86-1393(-)
MAERVISTASGGTEEIRAQAQELHRILEDTNTRWMQVHEMVRDMRGVLTNGEPAGGSTPASGISSASVYATPSASRALSRRSSAFAVGTLAEHQEALPEGASVFTVHTGCSLLGDLECVLVEPPGKHVAPQAYVSTGLVVCLQGLPASPSSLAEWHRSVNRSGWLDLGISVALPNLQMNAALSLDDIEAVMRGVLQSTGFETCMLVGKDWGGVLAVDLATRSSLAEQVVGIILLGPSSPAPMGSANLAVPVFLLWAEDDDISHFEELEDWKHSLDERCMPTTIWQCEKGGHRFDQVLESDGVAEATKKFTVSVFLMDELEKQLEEEHEQKASGTTPVAEKEGIGSKEENDSDEEQATTAPLNTAQRRSIRTERLTAELPTFMKEGKHETHPRATEEVSTTGCAAQATAPFKTNTVRRLSGALPHWIQGGMTNESE